MVKVNPIDILPNEESTSDQWIQFYKALVSAGYGEQASKTAFVNRWVQRKGSDVDVVEVERGTGMTLSKNAIDSIKSAALSGVDVFGGVFGAVGTTTKYMIYGVGGLVLVLVGVGIYKLFKASASDLGTAVGVAGKVYTGKP